MLDVTEDLKQLNAEEKALVLQVLPYAKSPFVWDINELTRKGWEIKSSRRSYWEIYEEIDEQVTDRYGYPVFTIRISVVREWGTEYILQRPIK